MEDVSIDFIRAMLKSKPRPEGWPQRRVRLDEVGGAWPVDDDIKLMEVNCDGVGGEWSIAPGSDPTRVLLYFHGGGYCAGSFASVRRLVSEAGRMAQIRTLTVNYRLAPEHPFPAALDDAFTAWRFLLGQGILANHIAIGGDSAGGGLSAALVNRLRDEHQPMPACAWLVSPWMDLTLSGSTMESKSAVDPMLNRAYLNEAANAYVPPGVDRKDPRVSPVFADLRGFVPTLIQVGSEETLLADATRFAEAAGAAGAAITLEIWPEMIHCWPLWIARLEPARRAVGRAGAFIRSRMNEAHATVPF